MFMITNFPRTLIQVFIAVPKGLKVGSGNPNFIFPIRLAKDND
jgi:hypothetical protein